MIKELSVVVRDKRCGLSKDEQEADLLLFGWPKDASLRVQYDALIPWSLSPLM